jgi:hypothetical protein
VVVVIVVIVIAPPPVLIAFRVRRRGKGRRAAGGASRRFAHERAGAIEDLVEFTAVEPDAPALRTEVDLDSLAVGH